MVSKMSLALRPFDSEQNRCAVVRIAAPSQMPT
jgi:hypothetical protein